MGCRLQKEKWGVLFNSLVLHSGWEAQDKCIEDRGNRHQQSTTVIVVFCNRTYDLEISRSPELKLYIFIFPLEIKAL
jgi:hypothetical protein